MPGPVHHLPVLARLGKVPSPPGLKVPVKKLRAGWGGVWRAGSPSTTADLGLLHPGGLQGGCAQSSAHPVWSFPCHVSVCTPVRVCAPMCASFCACACVGVRRWASPCVPVPVCAGTHVRASCCACVHVCLHEVVLHTHHGSHPLTSGKGCWVRRALAASPCPGAALAAIPHLRAPPAVSCPGPGARVSLPRKDEASLLPGNPSALTSGEQTG